MIKLLLQAKANPNAINRNEETPLKHAIYMMDRFTLPFPPLNPQTSNSLKTLRMLLRAGASLDNEAASDDRFKTAEDIISLTYHEDWSDNESVLAIKALVAGVRQHGTYKKYMRAPHRDFLAVRGLAQRGKLRTDHRTLNFIARLGERGVVWHILTYWRPTD